MSAAAVYVLSRRIAEAGSGCTPRACSCAQAGLVHHEGESGHAAEKDLIGVDGGDSKDEEFAIVFAAMGVNMETAHFFKQVRTSCSCYTRLDYGHLFATDELTSRQREHS